MEILKVVKNKPVSEWSANALKLAEVNFQNLGMKEKEDDMTTVQVNCIKKAIKFDVGDVAIKLGKKVKVIFTNPDDMQHNLVVVKPDTADSVAMAAIELGPKGNAMHWVPKGNEVIASTKLLNKDEKETIEVNFEKPGKYPFICSFPGHATVMRGHFIVK